MVNNLEEAKKYCRMCYDTHGEGNTDDIFRFKAMEYLLKEMVSDNFYLMRDTLEACVVCDGHSKNIIEVLEGANRREEKGFGKV